MVTVEQIQATLILADAYYLELLAGYKVSQNNGCTDCGCDDKLERIMWLSEQLEKRATSGILDDTTTTLYTCLVLAISPYSGAGLPIDPNASIPNVIIDVTIVGNNTPNELTFDWSDFINSGGLGRIRYENPLWGGFNPMLSVDNMPYLVVDVDYVVLPTGGFELLLTGNLPFIYDGQVMRAVGYEPYAAPPIPPSSILLDNQSSQSISYEDNGGATTSLGAGLVYGKNPVEEGQSFEVFIPVGTTLTVTKYMNGEEWGVPDIFTNPPAISHGDYGMESNLQWSYVVIDTI